MPLPKIQQHLFEIVIPSSGKKVKFRPFLMREEKIFLTAEESRDINEILQAMQQVINNCCQGKFDVTEAPLFDIEYIFLKLRARSVSNISEITIKDASDEKLYNFSIDLDKVEVSREPQHTNKLILDENIILVMKYPSIGLTEELIKAAGAKELTKEDIDFEITKKCIAQIYDKEKAYTNFTSEELEEFLLEMSIEQWKKVKEFFETIPKLRHKIIYKNSLGEEKTVLFEGMSDFFQ